jgi:hypothetical protein
MPAHPARSINPNMGCRTSTESISDIVSSEVKYMQERLCEYILQRLIVSKILAKVDIDMRTVYKVNTVYKVVKQSTKTI